MSKTKKAAQYILENIIGKEEIVSLEIEQKDDFIGLKIEVKESSIGKIIGKEGKTIKAIRNLLKIISYKETGKKLTVDVVKE